MPFDIADRPAQGPDLDPAGVEPAVDEDGRGAADARVEPGGEVGLHLVAEGLRGLPHDQVAVEPELVGVRPQRPRRRAGPAGRRAGRASARSAPCAPGGLGGQGRRQRVRMTVGEREVAEHQPDLPVGVLDHVPQHRRRRGAVRALVVAVLDDGDGRVRVAQDVIGGRGRGRHAVRVGWAHEVGVLGVPLDPAAHERALRHHGPAPAADVVQRGPDQRAAHARLPRVGVDLGVGEHGGVAAALVDGVAEHPVAVADLVAALFRDVPDGGLHADGNLLVPGGCSGVSLPASAPCVGHAWTASRTSGSWSSAGAGSRTARTPSSSTSKTSGARASHVPEPTQRSRSTSTRLTGRRPAGPGAA